MIPEDNVNHFSFPKFITPVASTLREVLDNEITTRDKISLNGLGTSNGKFVRVSMMLKTGIKMAQDYTVLINVPHKTTKRHKQPRENNSGRARS